MGLSELGPYIAPALGLIGVLIASKLTSRASREANIFESYDELTGHWKERALAEHARAENAVAAEVTQRRRAEEAERRATVAEAKLRRCERMMGDLFHQISEADDERDPGSAE